MRLCGGQSAHSERSRTSRSLSPQLPLEEGSRENARSTLYGGLHVGGQGVYGAVLARSGLCLARSKARFTRPEELGPAFQEAMSCLPLESLQGGTVVAGVDRSQRNLLNIERVPGLNFVQPHLASCLLGAIPQGPGLYLSLGRQVKLAAIDSTNRYREFRFVEGGGDWWLSELAHLSEHSLRLQSYFKRFKDGRPTLSHLPALLELGRFPNPCPVLKPRLEKMARHLADAVYRASSRLPGIRRFALGGFLAESAIGTLVSELLESDNASVNRVEIRFPPEIGSALLALAFDRENEERTHLGKPRFVYPEGEPWAPPAELLRKLYRLRKPFEEYPT